MNNNQVDRLLNPLLNLLEEKIVLLQKLDGVFKKEKLAVIGSDLGKLSEVLKEKENLLLMLRILEEQRARAVRQLSDLMGYSPKMLTIKELCKLIDEPLMFRLESCRRRLLSLADSIREQNQDNHALIVHSLDIVRSSLKMLDNLMVQCPVYYNTGKIKTCDQSGKVLSNEI